MSSACVFCKIAKGEIPSERVMENDLAFAFLDIKPLARGHVLVIPKRHAERVGDVLPDELNAMMALAQRAVRRQAQALHSPGATLGWNDGRVAGQEVPHTHLHVIPRYETDGVGGVHKLFATKMPTLREGELKELGAQLRG